MLMGWIYQYSKQALEILLVAFGLIALAHFDYMRSWAGSFTPLIAGALSVVWGVGAGGWMGINLDPLTIVVPVLLLARGLSHSVQMTRRDTSNDCTKPTIGRLPRHKRSARCSHRPCSGSPAMRSDYISSI